MRTYRVAEHFASINGESARAGELAYFVRFAGCNLACAYCDTAWANVPEVPCEALSAEAIRRIVLDAGIANVTLTGGEPLLQEGLSELLEALLAENLRVEIETNGSVSIRPFLDIAGRRPVFTLDYKLPGSGMESAMDTDNYRWIGAEDAVKFVVGGPADLARAREIIEEYQLAARCRVFLSPVFGSIEPARIVEYMLAHRMNGVRLQLQLHKFIWDPQRRGV